MANALFFSETTQQPPYLTPTQQPTLYTLSPPSSSSSFNLDSHVSPSILLLIIILAIIFFISGLLHLLVRFLLRPPTRDPDDVDTATALQGQLQQLFHLHDHGVDQSFIDTLPVFNYKSIIGAKKSPFDCAVCLCEFEQEDKLRLLPKCSHAFHTECIDTWLLSHSTCPLCRFNLVSDFSPNNNNNNNGSNNSPIVLVLESGSENSSREIITNSDANSREFGSTRVTISPKSCDYEIKIDEKEEQKAGPEEKVVIVKLGKYRNVDSNGGGEGSSEGNIDDRRCFSMGSFAYIVDEDTSLQVPIRTPLKKQSVKKTILPLTPGHRVAMSECGCDSRRDFSGFEPFKNVLENRICNNGNKNDGVKKESFSVSKIWMRGGKRNGEDSSSRRAFSFRFPIQGNNEGENEKNENRRTISEINFGSCGGNGSEFGFDEESGNNFYCSSSQASAPSFARRTLLWLVGRQNKVVHSSNFPPNQ